MIPACFFIRKQKITATFLPALLFFFLLIASSDLALAGSKMLLLNPIRAIFTDNQRSININVGNISDEPITYAISLVTMRKDENGKLREVKVETEQEQFVKNMVRFSPRKATIEPGKRQVVKLMIRKPQDLPPGEYQTRISFVPQVPQSPSQQNPASQAGQVTERKAMVNLDMLVTSTIPVIIQNGDISAEVTPLTLSLKKFPEAPSGMAAEVTLSRKGSASAFGNVFLNYVPANDPKSTREIGRIQDMAIYIPEADRAVTVPLANISRQELASGTVRVSFEPSTGVARQREKPGQKSFKDFPLR